MRADVPGLQPIITIFHVVLSRLPPCLHAVFSCCIRAVVVACAGKKRDARDKRDAAQGCKNYILLLQINRAYFHRMKPQFPIYYRVWESGHPLNVRPPCSQHHHIMLVSCVWNFPMVFAVFVLLFLSSNVHAPALGALSAFMHNAQHQASLACKAQ